jgi:hypothetical protein
MQYLLKCNFFCSREMLEKEEFIEFLQLLSEVGV